MEANHPMGGLPTHTGHVTRSPLTDPLTVHRVEVARSVFCGPRSRHLRRFGPIDPKARALLAAEAAQSKKGQNLTIIDLSEQATYADFLVIVSTYSERQCAAVGAAVSDAFKESFNERPMSREGQGVWILLDYGDVVVHVFHEDARAYYDIDRMWPNAPRLRVPPTEAMNVAG